ncbi:MAG: hypothetical protein H7061_04290 [Bdellovibrionaceae bacterium]|nr:hypothetical protein [Bdellovibrio sp.]
MPVHLRWGLIFFLFLSSSFGADSKPPVPEEKQKTSWSAKITRRQNEANKINDLTFAKLEVPVYLVQNQKRFRPYVELLIQYPSTTKDLFIGPKKLLRTKEGYFKISFFLTSKINQLLLEARPKDPNLAATQAPAPVGATGSTEIVPGSQVEKEVIYVVSPEAQEYKETDPLNILRVASGPSLLNYYQTGYDDYAAWMLWLGLSYTSPVIIYNLGWEGVFEGTIFPVKTNQSNIAPQVYHANVTAYYQFERNSSSAFQYSIIGGFDYLTMQSNGAAFGIKDLVTPRMAFATRYIINEQEDWKLKIGLNPGDIKLQQSGFDFDFSKGWLQSNGRRLEIGFKYQQYKIAPLPDISVRVVLSTLYLSYTL